MLRVLLLFLGLAAIAVAAAWLADHPGEVAFDWQGVRVETSIGVAGALALLLAASLLAIYRGWRWLAGGPRAWRQRRRLGRQRRGYETLTRGLIAVAAGDGAQGLRLAQRAGVLLEGSPLAHLLSAQAAQLEGDEAGAKRHFEALRAHPETEFLGLRGLIVLAKRAGRHQEARRLAEAAAGLRPDAAWAANELYLAQAADGDWDAALATLEQRRRKRLNAPESRRRRAIALYGRALRAEAAGEVRQALDRAQKAVAAAPEFVPANRLTVRLLAAAGELRRARKQLAEAWRRTPHPELAEAFAELGAGEPAAERLKAAENLAAMHPEAPESRILAATWAIEARDWAQAEAALDAALADGDQPRLCRLKARLAERSGGDAAAVRAWLERAAQAPPEAGWVCGDCGWHARAWQAICPQCGAFDRLLWARPAGEPTPPALLEFAPDAPSQELAPPAELLQMDQPERAGGRA